jgi:hypothetical protein
VQGIEAETELFWTIAHTSLALGACGVAYALGYVLYLVAEGVLSRRGVDAERHRFTLQGGAALIGILVVGAASYALYPWILMLLLLLRLLMGLAEAH